MGISRVQAAPLTAEQVAVVYNADSPQGRELALEYMQLRGIPDGNLVALFCSNNETITRDEYDEQILKPLRKFAVERNWWTFSRDKEKPFSYRRIYAMVLMSGVPLRIQHEPKIAGADAGGQSTNAASVDSELALMAFNDVPLKGMVPNPYFNKDENFVGSHMPSLLVTRLDSPSVATTRRMMADAAAVEKTGLWGWVLIDRGGPHAQGDKWLDECGKLAEKYGMPWMMDMWKETLASGYPVFDDIAVYLGWYAGSINGPFIEPDFRFKRGAVAMHIHSFSAATIRNPNAGWSGPLLEKGAAVTVGNVYEPYLSGSHHLHILFDRLLKGYTVAEAAAMSIPVLSWQSTVLGDPLYRPFAIQRSGTVVKNDEDKYFQAWWMAQREWGHMPTLKKSKLEDAAKATEGKSFFWEAMAYDAMRAGRKDMARGYFQSARMAAEANRDKVRVDMESANMMRSGGPDDVEFRTVLDSLYSRYLTTPYGKAIQEWKKRVTPPPPPSPAK